MVMAPQVRLELTTLRLRLIPCFHAGADYLINFPKGEVAGRLWGLIGGGSSTPSLCTFLTTVCSSHLPFRQASLRITMPARKPV
ncbi:MAG: hypothetical protein QOH51_3310 [Acidobacteriota bacterium]|nr:hypothetical protein [Acidobacteriota bacterium]